ncbi:tetratricopeptide repeat protein [bacterium]|nr:tetratricopeptide repeat protein [bacterium]
MTFNKILVVVVILFLICPANVQAFNLGKVFKESYRAEALKKTIIAIKLMDKAIVQKDKLSKTDKYAIEMRLAHLNNLIKKYNLTEKHYLESTKLMYNAIEPLQHLEFFYLSQKNWKKLIRTSKKTLKIDPKNKTSMTRIAFSYYSLKKYKKASDEYNKILKLYPLDLGVRNMIGWSNAYGKKKKEALKAFEKIIEFSPFHISAKRGLMFLKKK